MSQSFRSHINRLHKNFVRDLRYSAQLNERAITILPTVFFITGAFFLLSSYIHRRTYPSTPFFTFVYREIGFHWTYFYSIRVWFLIVKLTRLSAYVLQKRIKESPEKYATLASLNVDLCAFVVLTVLSLTPAFALWWARGGRRQIPNFLVWVGEDPWIRSEIGMAGHYLDRPPNFALPDRKDCAYRIRRSTSHVYATQKFDAIRGCKSDETLKCVRRLEELFVNNDE